VNWGAWILARALSLATLVLLTRVLGADALGALLSALAAGVLAAALAAGGLPDLTARQAAAATADSAGFGRGDLRRALARFAVVLPLAVAAVIAITSQSGDGFAVSEALAAVLLAVTQGVTTIMASVFRARGQPGRFALATNLAASAGRAGIALLALVLSWGGAPVLWAFAAVNLVVAALTWREAVRGLEDTSAVAEGEGALHLGGAVWGLLGNVDVVVVGLLLGAGPAGSYSVALRTAEFSAQFVIAISLFYMPEAARLAIAGSREALLRLYRTACRWSGLTTLLAAGLGYVTAPELGEILYPDDAATVATLLRVLFVGYAVQGMLGVSYATLVAIGAFDAVRRSALVSLPLVLGGTVAFTEAWGVRGAAWATVAAYLGLNGWWTWKVFAELRAAPFGRRSLGWAAACAGSWLAAAAAAELLSGAGPVATLAAASVAAAAAALALLIGLRAVEPAELALLRRATRRPASRGKRDPVPRRRSPG
jgi:O-antigen/teichoic acid export membrane protein